MNDETYVKNLLDAVLVKYAFDPENPELNYDLGVLYHALNQTAAAVSFYLRAAERTEDKDLAYFCLLCIANCFEKQGDRANTVRCTYKQALMLLPTRPEAYYLLSKHYESINEHMEGYIYAEMALNFCNFDSKPLRGAVAYPGKYGLIFQKAVCAWWWGKSRESRELFSELCQKYNSVMDESHFNSVANNLQSLGSGRDEDVFKKYDKSMHDKLRFKFKGSDKIERMFSQVYQDLFTLAVLKGKRNGKFLEIGGYTPYRGNNTALLEEEFGWNGVSVEIKPECVEEYRKARRTKVLCADATTVDYEKVLAELAPDGIVDYLQLDVEPPKVTFEAMLAIPFDKYKFAVITYEHDHYMDMTQSFRKKSRAFLKSQGYVLLVPNVASTGHVVFEDWWVHPDLVDKDIIEKMQINSDIVDIDKYMLLD